MRKPAVAIAAVLGTLAIGAFGFVTAFGPVGAAEGGERMIVVSDQDGDVLASLPLDGDSFSVSYRNSIYQTMAEERYVVAADGKYELVEIAADQLAVIEEYYAVPDAPRPSPAGDRRAYVVEPDPLHPAVFEALSIAATDLGERTIHIPGSSPYALWQLVDDDDPYLILEIEETP
ncbi:hypothetical protein [Cryobacterium sp. PH31-L1]|uniref:hypothetical protein n=1 Tax=Cryobacterium sp. PH31-L1 TaxID=3046199 RepID=UPI0024BB0BF6|nr:hypothetical protein [Cryobacterium sp. PH31-L1]MDJ0377319.1 hypothetical protein [Cryobacterium sp. PH31-L1]